MISFIIPAHNEEDWIGRCLAAIHEAMKLVGEPYEAVVVDDSSTDSTASIARQLGAQVIHVEHRQISATRNAGGQQARGDILFFVDADTLLNAPLIQSVMRGIGAGAVGGGCVPRFEGRLPLWWRLIYPLFAGGARFFRLAGGACQFCTSAAFQAIGGYSEKHYAAEDALFISALKRYGRVIIPTGTVLTSGRSLRAHSFSRIASVLIRLGFRGPDGFRKREGLDMWYQPKREKFQ
jgi:glycosyltransferase involved in cell wall biosynthesis